MSVSGSVALERARQVQLDQARALDDAVILRDHSQLLCETAALSAELTVQLRFQLDGTRVSAGTLQRISSRSRARRLRERLRAEAEAQRYSAATCANSLTVSVS